METDFQGEIEETIIDLNAPPLTLNPAEVAQVLGLGERQVRKWIADGALYSFRCGRRVCVPKNAVKRLLEKQEASEEARAQSRPALRLG